MTARDAAPGQAARGALLDRLLTAAHRIKNCDGNEVTCASCRHEISDVMEAADAYADADRAVTAAAAPPRDDAGTIQHVPTGATWVTWDHRKQPPWDLIAEAVSRLTGGAVKIRAGRESQDDGGDPDRRYAAIYRELPPEDE